MSADYSFSVSALDMSVAFDCEADRAEREHMSGTAERQRATALHIRNAIHHMQKICPEGYRVDTQITFTFVPDVNAVLRDDVRGRVNAILESHNAFKEITRER